tara:strand:+ start:189 stop:389 length:201 start_codon:yes stop_codon:yes gene_type:complete
VEYAAQAKRFEGFNRVVDRMHLKSHMTECQWWAAIFNCFVLFAVIAVIFSFDNLCFMQSEPCSNLA